MALQTYNFSDLFDVENLKKLSWLLYTIHGLRTPKLAMSMMFSQVYILYFWATVQASIIKFYSSNLLENVSVTTKKLQPGLAEVANS